MNENNQNQGADILNLTWIERPNPNHFETFRLITFKPGSIFDITIESKPFSNFIPHLNECIMTFSRKPPKIKSELSGELPGEAKILTGKYCTRVSGCQEFISSYHCELQSIIEARPDYIL